MGGSMKSLLVFSTLFLGLFTYAQEDSNHSPVLDASECGIVEIITGFSSGACESATSTQYYPNGKVAGTKGSTWYHSNGKTAGHKGGTWYYANGVTAGFEGGTWYHPNGKPAGHYNGTWYYSNGKTAGYNGGAWYYPNGSFMGNFSNLSEESILRMVLGK